MSIDDHELISFPEIVHVGGCADADIGDYVVTTAWALLIECLACLRVKSTVSLSLLSPRASGTRIFELLLLARRDVDSSPILDVGGGDHTSNTRASAGHHG